MSRPGAPAQPKLAIDRNVQHVVLGDLLFKTWYQSIYPETLVNKETDRLYVCRWCFRYTTDAHIYGKHTRACENRTTPPGTKVYEHAGYSVWEVDGEANKLFGQNLCLFSKLFLDHKSVFFDVGSFLFYVLVFTDPDHADNHHILGYFSKEKLSWDPNNLACILVFPPYQHKQLGKLLMGVSYKLSAWEQDAALIGGPERPLSDMGRKSYVRFWEERVARYLLLRAREDDSNDDSQQKNSRVSGKDYPQESITARDIGLDTGMLTEDVVTALVSMGAIESTSPTKKRKKSQPPANATLGNGRGVTVRKSSVLEWAKIHHVAVQDPVFEDGFLDGWDAQIDGVEGSDSLEDD